MVKWIIRAYPKLNSIIIERENLKEIPMQDKKIPLRYKPMTNILFGSRWLQLPLYLGLIVAQCVYVFHFMVELTHLVEKVPHLGEADIMLIVLGLIDVVMISNLLIMVIIGGYETFVSRLDLEGHPDEPDWLSHVNANLLKIKLATAIIGISSIHLLKTFINAPNLDEKTMLWQTVIHMAFVISAVSIAYIDKLMTPVHVAEKKEAAH